MKVIKSNYKKSDSGLWLRPEGNGSLAHEAGRSADNSVGPVMLTVCGLASAAVAPNCANPIFGNMEPVFWLANKSEISSFTVASNVCTAITRVSTKLFYAYETFKTGNAAKSSMTKLKYTSLYQHEFSTIIWKIDGATLLQLQNIAQGQVVLIGENKYKGTAGEAAFRIYGREQGLELEVSEMDTADADTQGAVKLTFKTPAGSYEGAHATPFFNTNYATTAAAVAALLA